MMVKDITANEMNRFLNGESHYIDTYYIDTTDDIAEEELFE